ncbi:hypothetical protein C0991_010631 [Blastosporella zonata]|nr:hypothetical protein C0991_010631 [Blastosporella zonata]
MYSNMVSIVVAITALRKCHLTFVQSTLMGSMLSKLLLVLGLCFFAGGTRFPEQGFDRTSIQLHSSLLTISVGALFLPAAYHFALGGTATGVPDSQKQGILHMSHGVSIVLLSIYAAYLVFQLWSHSYLYSDVQNGQSLSFSARDLKALHDGIPPRDQEIEEYVTSPTSADRDFDDLIAHPVKHRVYMANSSQTHPSQLSLAPAESANSSRVALVEPKGRLGPQTGGYPMTRVSSARSGYSTGSGDTIVYRGSQDSNGKAFDTGQGNGATKDMPHEPRVGFVLVVLVLAVVTITASITADWLVDSMDGVSSAISKEWVGLILLPAVTSLAGYSRVIPIFPWMFTKAYSLECMTAVNVSVKDELSFSIGVAVGSAIVHGHPGMDNG